MDRSGENIARQRSDRIKRIAESLGFAACGVCDAAPIGRGDYVRAWLAAGRHGEMSYLQESVETRLDPGKLQPGCKSVIVVAWLYRVRETEAGLPMTVTALAANADGGATSGDLHPVQLEGAPVEHGTTSVGPLLPDTRIGEDVSEAGPSGRIARYAWGRDYHRVMRKRLYNLVDALRVEVREPFKTRVCVDIWPVLERELAERAGIGWIGSNCLVLSPSLGSYFCLGTVLTTLALATDRSAPDGCGTCRRCVDACPTGALFEPRKMDARRCLSYLTVEHRNSLPAGHSEGLHGNVFGCDICQQVCPYNGPRAPISIDPDAQARWPAGQIACGQVLDWSQADWDRITRGRALRRATREMWQRNARVVLSNPGP